MARSYSPDVSRRSRRGRVGRRVGCWRGGASRLTGVRHPLQLARPAQIGTRHPMTTVGAVAQRHRRVHRLPRTLTTQTDHQLVQLGIAEAAEIGCQQPIDHRPQLAHQPNRLRRGSGGRRGSHTRDHSEHQFVSPPLTRTNTEDCQPDGAPDAGHRVPAGSLCTNANRCLRGDRPTCCRG